MIKAKEFIIGLWLTFSAFIVVFSLFMLVWHIFHNGWPVISFEFLTSSPAAFHSSEGGGIYPALAGSLLLTLIAGLFAIIFAVPVALFKTLFLKENHLSKLISIINYLIASIPSIVLGLFGYAFFVIGLGTGKSLLAGGLTLGIMIYPFLEIRIENSIKEIPLSLTSASQALGVSRSYYIRKLLLPMTYSEIISAVVLSLGYAMGATSPLIMTAAVLYADVPTDLLDPVMSLPTHLYTLINQGSQSGEVFGTALVLLTLVFIINTATLFLGGNRDD